MPLVYCLVVWRKMKKLVMIGAHNESPASGSGVAVAERWRSGGEAVVWRTLSA